MASFASCCAVHRVLVVRSGMRSRDRLGNQNIRVCAQGQLWFEHHPLDLLHEPNAQPGKLAGEYGSSELKM